MKKGLGQAGYLSRESILHYGEVQGMGVRRSAAGEGAVSDISELMK